MSAVLLNYLKQNSPIVTALDAPTINDILHGQPDPGKAAQLLECLPALATESLKLSNCLLDDQLPYDSIANCTDEDIKNLQNLLIIYVYQPI